MGLVAHFLLEKRWQLDQLLHLELCLTPELCLLLLQPVVCLTPLLFLILLPPELRLFLLLSVVFLILLLPANQPALQPESFSSLGNVQIRDYWRKGLMVECLPLK